MKQGIISLIVFFISFTVYSADWKAKWIVAFDNQNVTNSWYVFCKQTDVAKVPGQAIARIAVDSKYWLWINGEPVVFEGGLKRGPNPTDTYYDEIDIAPWLKQGKNTVTVLMWYFGKDGFSHISSGKAGLLFECVTPEWEIISDKTWRGSVLKSYGMSKGPVPNFRLSESNVSYDARQEIGDWTSSGFDPNKLQEVRVFGEAGCYPWNKLHRRSIPMFRNYGLKSFPEKYRSGDTLICKLPYNCQFTPYIKLKASEGRAVKMFTDSYLLFSPSTCIYGEYITKDGIQEYEHLAWINGHKMYYVIPDGAEVIDVRYRETGYDADFSGYFNCSDDFLNRLWKKSCRSLYITMRDNFMDCPDRERAQWAGDAVNESLEAYYALSVSSHKLVRKWLEETVNWQRPDGSMFAPVPAGNWFDELPGQVLATIGEYGIWYYYMYSADKTLIKELYPKIKKYLELWEPDGKGTMKFRNGDCTWGDWGEHKDMVLLYNLWYYIAVRGMYNMAVELDYANDAMSYGAFLEKFKKSFNGQFWNGNAYRHPLYEGAVDDRVQALAVVSGIADKSKYPSILNIFKQEEHASPYMEKYVFEAMMLMGYEKEAIARHEKRFAYMVNHPDYTTLFEGWGIGKDGFGGGTVNHGWSGGGLVVCSQYICGVSPVTPGFEKFRIMPQPGPLKYAETKVPSVKGEIKSAFQVKDKKFYLQAGVPEGSNATIGIPKLRKYKVIKINDRLVWSHGKYVDNGIVSEGIVTDRYITFSCPAGIYSFIAE